MTGKVRLLMSVAVGGLAVLFAAQSVGAQASGPPLPTAAERVSSGSLQGEVRDESGAPLEAAIVSVVGTATAVTVSDARGHFEFSALSPGPYAVRAHLKGFATPVARPLEILANTGSVRTITLRKAEESYPVLAAGFGDLVQRDTADVSGDQAESAHESSHDAADHTDVAWRIRHARRSVLKESGRELVDLVDGEQPEPEALVPLDILGGSAYQASSLATQLSMGTQVSGQVNLYTAGALDDPKGLFTSERLSRGVAYVRVGAPVGVHGKWSVRGALNQADISTWFVSGAYEARADTNHRFDMGVSYASQRYDGGNLLTLREVTDGSRNIGSVRGLDAWMLGPALEVAYGGEYARYDYLERSGIFSPRFEVTMKVADGLRLAGAFSRRGFAPGSEEFLPPNDGGLWLPPQRTFSPIEAGRAFEAERVTHVELRVERDLGESTVSVQLFHQDVADQLVALFGADMPGAPSANVGHYLVGNAGNANATGCRAEFRTAISKRLRGSVGYSFMQASLTQSDDVEYLVVLAPSALRPDGERIHDVSTRIEADVPETATRVLILYRLSNGFAHAAGASPVPSLGPRRADSRFDVQVRQSLPFVSFYGARLEALLAVRNFFRDAQADSSVYDELLVVSPPKQFVGGVTVHF